MRTDKLLPCGGRLAFGSRRYAMALEDIAHRLVTDRQAQVRVAYPLAADNVSRLLPIRLKGVNQPVIRT